MGCRYENLPGGCQKQDCTFKHEKNYDQEGYGEDDGSKGGQLDSKVGNFLERFRQTLTPNKDGSMNRSTYGNLEAGEIEDNEPYLRSNTGSMLSKSLLGSP